MKISANTINWINTNLTNNYHVTFDMNTVEECQEDFNNWMGMIASDENITIEEAKALVRSIAKNYNNQTAKMIMKLTTVSVEVVEVIETIEEKPSQSELIEYSNIVDALNKKYKSLKASLTTNSNKCYIFVPDVNKRKALNEMLSMTTKNGYRVWS